ncbi:MULTISPECIES: YugN family protein [Oceanobacillus]|uniref:YugN-like family protein n=2 Tax=Oceanobacillus TaxID=182709 RepID=A0A0A1MRK5_9BACI|nr:YugN family protein [Oceanobacillus oncorhynchi]MDM8101170.1 YugN family protein [Oceanobacillus oncorhynchi]CEI82242.1 YugN-like family protein [Oceanobacillus oncorhynchi]
MIALHTNLPGKQGVFLKLKLYLKELGFTIAENSNYHGYFNGLLSSQAERKLYLYLPYRVLQEEHNQPSVQIEFGNPQIIHHADIRYFDSFQAYLHKPDLYDWKLKGEQAVQQIINHIDNNL